jgi:hypothetical protein
MSIKAPNISPTSLTLLNLTITNMSIRRLFYLSVGSSFDGFYRGKIGHFLSVNVPRCSWTLDNDRDTIQHPGFIRTR